MIGYCPTCGGRTHPHCNDPKCDGAACPRAVCGWPGESCGRENGVKAPAVDHWGLERLDRLPGVSKRRNQRVTSQGFFRKPFIGPPVPMAWAFDIRAPGLPWEDAELLEMALTMDHINALPTTNEGDNR